MNANEYGNKIRINVNEDISLNTNSLKLISPTPYRTSKTITEADGLVVGDVNVQVGQETYLADEYLEYEFQDGDIFVAGEWEVKVISEALDLSFRKINDTKLTFTVSE